MFNHLRTLFIWTDISVGGVAELSHERFLPLGKIFGPLLQSWDVQLARFSEQHSHFTNAVLGEGKGL